MVLKMDNQEVAHSANNWSVGGRTRHIDVKSVLLWELIEADVLVIRWISGTTNEADIFTKNLDGPTFQRYTKIFTGGTDYDWVSSLSHIQVRRVLWVVSQNSGHVYENEVRKYDCVCEMIDSMYTTFETHRQIFRLVSKYNFRDTMDGLKYGEHQMRNIWILVCWV